MNKQIYQLVYDSCLAVAKSKGRIVIVITKEQIDKTNSGLNIIKNPSEFKKLCSRGGNILIDSDGHVISDNATLNLDEGMSFMVLKESGRLLVFNDGHTMIDVDQNEETVKKSRNVIIKIFESIGAGTVGSIGTGFLVPAAGIAFLPGVILFGSAYVIGKSLLEKRK